MKIWVAMLMLAVFTTDGLGQEKKEVPKAEQEKAQPTKVGESVTGKEEWPPLPPGYVPPPPGWPKEMPWPPRKPRDYSGPWPPSIDVLYAMFWSDLFSKETTGLDDEGNPKPNGKEDSGWTAEKGNVKYANSFPLWFWLPDATDATKSKVQCNFPYSVVEEQRQGLGKTSCAPKGATAAHLPRLAKLCNSVKRAAANTCQKFCKVKSPLCNRHKLLPTPLHAREQCQNNDAKFNQVDSATLICSHIYACVCQVFR